MKEIMAQYGHSVIAALIAVLLFSVIGVASAGNKDSLYAQTGKAISAKGAASSSANAEFERYWRLR